MITFVVFVCFTIQVSRFTVCADPKRFQSGSKGVPKGFQRGPKGVPKVFQRGFKEVPKRFQKGVPTRFQSRPYSRDLLI